MSEESSTLDPVTARTRIVALIDEFYGRIDRGLSIADLLEEEAKFITPARQADGREAFAALMLSLYEKRRQNGRTARHISCSVNVESLGSGKFRVRSQTMVFALDSGPDAQGSLNIGDHDDIVRVDTHGVCRFVERAMTPALAFSLAPSLGGP